jgi:hypothetical protein
MRRKSLTRLYKPSFAFGALLGVGSPSVLVVQGSSPRHPEVDLRFRAYTHDLLVAGLFACITSFLNEIYQTEIKSLVHGGLG